MTFGEAIFSGTKQEGKKKVLPCRSNSILYLLLHRFTGLNGKAEEEELLFSSLEEKNKKKEIFRYSSSISKKCVHKGFLNALRG